MSCYELSFLFSLMLALRKINKPSKLMMMPIMKCSQTGNGKIANINDSADREKADENISTIDPSKV